MELGSTITITKVYRRRTRYERRIPRQHYDTRMKVWEAWEIKPRAAIFLGWRTLRNGASEWEDEVGFVFDADSYFKVALVCFSTRENPVYVPVESVVAERARADAAKAELEALREYKAYWEPKIKEISDLYTRQGGELATVTQLARDLIASIHGDGNGRCWCGACEADRLRSFLERNTP